MVAFTPGLSLLMLPAALFGVAQGIILPNVFSLLNANAPTENRGAFMATNGMSLRAGQTIGPLVMASATGTLGLTGAYLTAAGLAPAPSFWSSPSCVRAFLPPNKIYGKLSHRFDRARRCELLHNALVVVFVGFGVGGRRW